MTTELAVVRGDAQVWRDADKGVYSLTLEGVSTVRTRIERQFEPEAVRQLKDASISDLSIGGAALAAQGRCAGRWMPTPHLAFRPVGVDGCEMERPFRTPGGSTTGIIAVVLAGALGVMLLPGMPAALVWPYEWIILLVWMLVGVVFVSKVPKMGRGPDSCDELVRITEARASRGRTAKPEPEQETVA